jgi:GNAT superfamily N-acetyltransferase
MSFSAPSDIAERWITTWTYARGLEVSTVEGWPLVQVRSRTRETELICLDPGPAAFVGLMRQVDGDPRAMLTVLAPDVSPYAALTLPSGVRVDRDDETLMATALTPLRTPPLGSCFTTRWETIGHQTRYAVESGDRIAADGLVGVLDEDATYDAVETSPGFRRQGLGRHVMAALTTHALQSGARTGVLAATAQGRRLYESLGWSPACQMLSLMGAEG